MLDATAVTAVDPSSDEIHWAAKNTVFSVESKRAFVTSSEQPFGMARVYEAYHNTPKAPSQFSVFYGMSSALEWLGLKENEDLPV